MVMKYKVRTGAYQRDGEPIKVLTVPPHISIFSEKVSYTAALSGTSIVYTSGAIQTITPKQIEEYQYEDCRLEW